MRALDVRGGVRRRWYVFLVGVLATVALAFAAYAGIGPTREMKASALLLPPATGAVGSSSRSGPGNPFLGLDGIDPALSVLVTKMMSEGMSHRLLAGADQTDYTVAEDPLSQAPIVVVTAKGSSAAQAATVLDRVMKQMPRTLTDLQDAAGVRTATRITLVPLVRDDKPAEVWGSLLRLEILIVGAGLVGTVLLAGLWDALAQSAAARGGAKHAAAGEGAPSAAAAQRSGPHLVREDAARRKAHPE